MKKKTLRRKHLEGNIKSLMATWDDSNTSLDEDEAQVNMTIMVSVQFDSDSETLDENENEVFVIFLMMN